MNSSGRNTSNDRYYGIIGLIKNIFGCYHGIIPFVCLPLVLMLWKRKRYQQQLPDTSSTANSESNNSAVTKKAETITILYSTTTGTAKKLSEELQQRLQKTFHLNIRAIDLKDYDPDTLENEQMVFFICSTWTDGTLAVSSQPFLVWLEDLANDFRISKMYLEKLKYGIFGLGGKIYGENYCKAVRF